MFAETTPLSVLSIRAYPIISPRPFGGRRGGGEGGSNRCRFSQSILTFVCPRPTPLPEGEGVFGMDSWLSRDVGFSTFSVR